MEIYKYFIYTLTAYTDLHPALLERWTTPSIPVYIRLIGSVQLSFLVPVPTGTVSLHTALTFSYNNPADQDT